MAEGHTEDCPLLGHTSPAPPWPLTPPPPAPHDPPLPPWPPDARWGGGGGGEVKSGGGSSQGSMDSGCECDLTSPPTPPPGPSEVKGGKEEEGGGDRSCPPPPVAAAAAPPPPPPVAKVTFSFEGGEEEEGGDLVYDPRYPPPGLNNIETASQNGSEPGEIFKEQVLLHSAAFPRVPSYSRQGVLSSSSSTASMAMCRICHHPQGDGLDTLISPCRCAGTMQFIHQGCLNKWLEVKRCKKAPVCELCNYQFHRHKKFRLHHWQLPTCTRIDKLLHSIFLLCLLLMVACATITIICFKQDRLPPRKDEAELTKSEVVTLTCGVLFFVAFFVAMYVEVKARNTLYRLFTRFLYLNQTWHIAEYDKRRDALVNSGGLGLAHHAPV